MHMMPTPQPKVRIEDDHEISMALAQVYRAAKCAMEIHKMLHQVDNLEGWMQSKITLAADYLESVSSNLEYDIVSAVMEPQVDTNIMDMPMVSVHDTQADLVETNAVLKAKQDGFAVGSTQIQNGKPKNPHRPGSPEHRAWQQAHDDAKSTHMKESQVDEQMFPQLRQDIKNITAKTKQVVGAHTAAARKYWHGTPEEQAQEQRDLEAAWLKELHGVPNAREMARELAARGKRP